MTTWASPELYWHKERRNINLECSNLCLSPKPELWQAMTFGLSKFLKQIRIENRPSRKLKKPPNDPITEGWGWSEWWGGGTSGTQNTIRFNIIENLSRLSLIYSKCLKGLFRPRGQSFGLEVDANLCFGDRTFLLSNHQH